MRIATSHSVAPAVAVAVQSAYDQLVASLGGKPDLLLAFFTVAYDAEALYRALREAAGDVPIQGGTSCSGVSNERGFHSEAGRSLVLWGIRDENGFFGVGAAELMEDPAASAKLAVDRARENAGMTGELPTAIWLTSAPGCEEQVLQGITERLGDEVCLVGGSAADDDLTGKWRQLTSAGVCKNAVTVAAFFLDTAVSTAFHSGYDPTDKKGVVTKVGPGRTLSEINRRPAATIYNEWTNGAIQPFLKDGGNILEISNLLPLGRKLGAKGGIPYYLLSHPERATAKGEITLFTDVRVGDELFCMQGKVDNLVQRAARVIEHALSLADFERDAVAGAIVTFCAGCMLKIGSRMNEAIDNMRAVLGEGIPFLVTHSYGEQGEIGGYGNKHGNLMISALLFERG